MLENSNEPADADPVGSAFASTEVTIRSVRRSLGTGVFLMASLTILLPLFGFGPKARLDRVPVELRLGIIGLILATEAFVITMCALASKRAPASFFQAFRKTEPFTPEGDRDLDTWLARYYLAYGFKAVVQMACLLAVEGLASILYSITDSYGSMANLAMVVGLVVVFQPTRPKMERWARPRAVEAWVKLKGEG